MARNAVLQIARIKSGGLRLSRCIELVEMKSFLNYDTLLLDEFAIRKRVIPRRNLIKVYLHLPILLV